MKIHSLIRPPNPDPAIAPFENGLAALRLDNKVMGHVATTLESFWSPFNPLRNQWWVWFIVVWADGTREQAEEDYPPWTFVREIQSGYFDGPGGVRYEAQWLSEPERTRMWDELDLKSADF